MALEKTLPIMCIFGIGLLLKRMGVLKKEHAPMLGKLILNVALPATIVSSLWVTNLAPKLLLLPVAGIVIATTLFGVGWGLAPLLGLNGKTREAFLIAFPTLELGSIGYAYMLSLYGPSGLAQIALLDLGCGFFFFSVVAFFAHSFARSGERFRVSSALKTFCLNPVLWAYGIGIGFNLLHVHFTMLANLLSTLSQALLLLMMLLIAVEFKLKLSSLTLPTLATYLKLCLGIVVGLLVCLIFGFSGMTRIAVIFGASLPASLMTVVYARDSNLDAQFLASSLSIALPVAIGGSSILISLMSHTQ